ncbi:MAG: YlxR family protein [Oscillospiraceae bacterium]|nr:YlxR family protein [Oscillospiraceae bacterium]
MPNTVPHTPIRHCIACRKGLPKGKLLRIARLPDNFIALDSNGKAQGRGAYVCPATVCVQKAQKSRALERQFKRQIDIAVYENLMEKCSDRQTT